MDLTRRDLLKYALGMPAASWLTNFRALAAPASKMVKLTAIKTMGLDNVGDGGLISIETDPGVVGYGETAVPSAAARETNGNAQRPVLLDPLLCIDALGRGRSELFQS